MSVAESQRTKNLLLGINAMKVVQSCTVTGQKTSGHTPLQCTLHTTAFFHKNSPSTCQDFNLCLFTNRKYNIPFPV